MFWLRDRGDTWVNSIAGCLSVNSAVDSEVKRFESGNTNYEKKSKQTTTV
jgi:hypothetical protein